MSCPFCAPGIQRRTLWESEHYRVFADAFPIRSGHVLLATIDHLPAHMSAPGEWAAELHRAQAHVRDFLHDTFGHASMWENGATPQQQVPHAHLHGVPLRMERVSEWVAAGTVRPVDGWEAARIEYARLGSYCFAESDGLAFLVDDVAAVLADLSQQNSSSLGAVADGGSGTRHRGGRKEAARTRRLWRAWSAAHVSIDTTRQARSVTHLLGSP